MEHNILKGAYVYSILSLLKAPTTLSYLFIIIYRHVNTLSPLKIGTLVCKTIIDWQFGKRVSVQVVKAVYVRVFQLGEGEYCENYRKISLIAFIGPAKGPQQAALLLCIVPAQTLISSHHKTKIAGDRMQGAGAQLAAKHISTLVKRLLLNI